MFWWTLNIALIKKCDSFFLYSGPKARDILSEITNFDLSPKAFPFFSFKEIDIGLVNGIRAMNLTHTGELGWVLYIPNEVGFIFFIKGSCLLLALYLNIQNLYICTFFLVRFACLRQSHRSRKEARHDARGLLCYAITSSGEVLCLLGPRFRFVDNAIGMWSRISY